MAPQPKPKPGETFHPNPWGHAGKGDRGKKAPNPWTGNPTNLWLPQAQDLKFHQSSIWKSPPWKASSDILGKTRPLILCCSLLEAEAATPRFLPLHHGPSKNSLSWDLLPVLTLSLEEGKKKRSNKKNKRSKSKEWGCVGPWMAAWSLGCHFDRSHHFWQLRGLGGGGISSWP